jgi:N-acetylglutamate synthase-like GNAT family acetyltransferase
MSIRKATLKDEDRICDLLAQLGYPNTRSFFKEKLETIEQNPNSELFVYEQNDKVVGVVSIDFIPQLALKGDFARISYLAVDASVRSAGIGKELEELCERLATERKCDRIELHCADWRTGAHRFYTRQGYVESPKYFTKMVKS